MNVSATTTGTLSPGAVFGPKKLKAVVSGGRGGGGSKNNRPGALDVDKPQEMSF